MYVCMYVVFVNLFIMWIMQFRHISKFVCFLFVGFSAWGRRTKPRGSRRRQIKKFLRKYNFGVEQILPARRKIHTHIHACNIIILVRAFIHNEDLSSVECLQLSSHSSRSRCLWILFKSFAVKQIFVGQPTDTTKYDTIYELDDDDPMYIYSLFYFCSAF